MKYYIVRVAIVDKETGVGKGISVECTAADVKLPPEEFVERFTKPSTYAALNALK